MFKYNLGDLVSLRGRAGRKVALVMRAARTGFIGGDVTGRQGACLG